MSALVVVKPDGTSRGLDDVVIRSLLNNGLKVVGLYRWTMTQDEAERLYEPHRGKEFFDDLVKFMTSGESVIIRVVGDVETTVHVRQVVAKIRNTYATSTRENVVHGSDSPEAAVREVAIFFA